MTREEIRALIGGYATSSLTEVERRVLFEAALEDQEIFEELAREQALKDAIDQPGARDRLLRVMEPRVRVAVWWRRPRIWVLGLTTAAALIVAMFMLRPAHQQEMARLEPAAPPAPAMEAPRAEAPLPAPAPVKKSKTSPPPSNQVGVVGGLAAPQETNTPAPAPAAIAPPAMQRKAAPMAAPMSSPAPATPARAMGVEQARDAASSALLAKPFGFTYSIDWQGEAVITPLTNGYLSIVADSITSMFQTSEVRAGIALHAPVPASAASITIQFTAGLPGSSTAAAPVTQSSDTSGQAIAPALSPDAVVRLRVLKK